MMILKPEDPALEEARAALNCAMQLLTKSLDFVPDADNALSETELEIIRARRASVMLEAAKRLHDKVCGIRTRGV